MEVNNNVKVLLSNLREKYGDAFSFDQEAIEKEVFIEAAQFSNLAIKILSVIGGIFGSLFFLGFLFLMGLYETPIVAILFGVLLLVMSLYIDRNETSVLVDTICISSFLIGGFLIGFGMADEISESENLLFIISIIISLVSFFLAKGYMLRLIGVLIFNASCLGLILENEINSAFHFQVIFLLAGYISLSFFETKWITRNAFSNSIYKPLYSGFLVSFSFALFLLANSWKMEIYFLNSWISAAAIFLANLYSASKILEGLMINDHRNKIFIYGLSLFIFLPTLLMPAVGGAILILLVSYHLRYRVGIVLGIIGLVYFGIQFYYDLNWTLLLKSVVLMISGGVFLLINYLHNKVFTNKKSGVE